MNILIVGDSFAADWSVKPGNVPLGWPNLLSKKYNVVNIAQAGVSEYKILQQVRSFPDLTEFDVVIISHTSPTRLHTKQHPVHKTGLHKNADLIFSDIAWHSSRPLNFFNKALQSAYNYFVYHYDREYYEEIYELIYNEITKILDESGVKVIVVDGFNSNPDADIDLYSIKQKNPGDNNHLDLNGSRIAYDRIVAKLNEL